MKIYNKRIYKVILILIPTIIFWLIIFYSIFSYITIHLLSINSGNIFVAGHGEIYEFTNTGIFLRNIEINQYSKIIDLSIKRNQLLITYFWFYTNMYCVKYLTNKSPVTHLIYIDNQPILKSKFLSDSTIIILKESELIIFNLKSNLVIKRLEFNNNYIYPQDVSYDDNNLIVSGYGGYFITDTLGNEVSINVGCYYDKEANDFLLKRITSLKKIDKNHLLIAEELNYINGFSGKFNNQQERICSYLDYNNVEQNTYFIIYLLDLTSLKSKVLWSSNKRLMSDKLNYISSKDYSKDLTNFHINYCKTHPSPSNENIRILDIDHYCKYNETGLVSLNNIKANKTIWSINFDEIIKNKYKNIFMRILTLFYRCKIKISYPFIYQIKH